MSKWTKKLNVIKFRPAVVCPYCPETFPTNLALCRHVLRKHNWNEDFLKGFEIMETHGAVMVVRKVEHGDE